MLEDCYMKYASKGIGEKHYTHYTLDYNSTSGYNEYNEYRRCCYGTGRINE